jgi:hypothetical protein
MLFLRRRGVHPSDFGISHIQIFRRERAHNGDGTGEKRSHGNRHCDQTNE